MGYIQSITSESARSRRYSNNSAVFCGDSAKWQKYLGLSATQRYEPETLFTAKPVKEGECFEFVSSNRNTESGKPANLLQEGFNLFTDVLKDYPPVAKIIKKGVFSNKDNAIVPIHIRSSKNLPADATREIFLGDVIGPKTISIVIKCGLLRHVVNALKNGSEENESERLGLLIACQLGIGEFGRVYEAINLSNPNWPQKVVVKVDRIYSTRKNQTIQVKDVMLKLSRDLRYTDFRYFSSTIDSLHNYHTVKWIPENNFLSFFRSVTDQRW